MIYFVLYPTSLFFSVERIHRFCLMPTARHTFASFNRLPGCPSYGGWVVMCAFFVGLLASALNAHAAGCHYAAVASSAELHAGGQPGKLAQTAWWSTAKVRCVYDSGKLVYFQVPSDGLPCHGPGCRGKSPEDRMQAPVVVESQRQNLFGELAEQLPSGNRPPIAVRAHEVVESSSPVLSGLFRPPCF